jgi:hypothetical protein
VDFVAAGPSHAPSTARIEKPSWFGESVGRYENGELVVDAIGLAEHPYGFRGQLAHAAHKRPPRGGTLEDRRWGKRD